MVAATTLEHLISRKKLAEKLEVSERTLSRWHKDGVRGLKLEQVTVGNRVYYDQAKVDEFIREQQREPGQ